MEQTKALFEEIASYLLYIVPRCENWDSEDLIRAGKLTISTKENWNDADMFDQQFMAVKVTSPGMEQLPINKEYFIKEYAEFMEKLKADRTFEKTFNLEVAACIAQTKSVSRYMDDTELNEAAVRISMGDPIASAYALCYP